MSEKRHGFRITSIIIAIAMTFGAFVVLIGPSAINVSASITGDSYSGSGNWVITQNTTYDGETLTVYGNIYVNSSAIFTLLDTVLTMDERTAAYNRNITLNTGTLKIGTDSELKTTNATAGEPKCALVLWQGTENIMVSNATVRNVYFPISSSGSYFDNSTFDGSAIDYKSGGTKLNVTNNLFENNSDVKTPIYLWLGTNGIVKSNEFKNSTWASTGIVRLHPSATGSKVLNNYFSSTVYGSGIYGVGLTASVSISNNRFVNISSKDSPDSLAAGIYVTSAGAASIDNNTMEYIGTNLTTFAAIGIWLKDGATGYLIADNHIWTVQKAGYSGDSHPPAYGIYVESDNVQIYRNNIGNVTSHGEWPGGCPAGIFVGNDVFQTDTSTSDVIVSANRIDNLDDSVNGIVLTSGGEEHTVTDCEVKDNIIGSIKIYNTSVGIGMYGEEVTNIFVHDNNLYNLWHNAHGIRQATGASDIMIYENNITVIDYGEIVPGVCGAFSIATETHYSTGADSIFRDNQVFYSGQARNYPAYNFSYNYQGTPVIVITNQSGMITTQKSYFTLRGFAGNQIIAENGINLNCTVYPTYWERPITHTDTDYHFVNVTITTMMATPASGILDLTMESWDLGSSSVIASWKANGTSDVTFTLSGLDSGKWYRVEVDGETLTNIQASGGSISFTYSGPWSEHEFEVISSFGNVSPTESTLLGLVIMFVIVGILLIPVAFIVKTAKEKKKPEIKDFIEIALIVAIGLGFVGVMWSMLG